MNLDSTLGLDWDKDILFRHGIGKKISLKKYCRSVHVKHTECAIFEKKQKQKQLRTKIAHSEEFEGCWGFCELVTCMCPYGIVKGTNHKIRVSTYSFISTLVSFSA